MRLKSSRSIENSSTLGCGLLLGALGPKIENFKGHNGEKASMKNNSTASEKY